MVKIQWDKSKTHPLLKKIVAKVRKIVATTKQKRTKSKK